MCFRSTALIACFALAAPVLPVRAEEKAPAPTLVVRLKSVDGLITDARYLGEAAGKSEEAKQGEKFLRSFIGDNGFEGFDIKKPVALYGRLAKKFEESDLVLMVPIADEKPLLDALKRFDIKAEKGQDDIYKVDLPNLPFGKLGSVYFRFTNGYAYITARNSQILAKERLLAPAAVVPPDWDAVFEVNLDLEQVPSEIKDLVVSMSSLRLGDAKEKKKPGETDAQHALRSAAADEVATQIKAILEEGKELNIRLDLDRKNAEGVFAARFTAKPGTKLAAGIAELAQGKSIVANLSTTGSALTGRVFAVLPERLRKPLNAIVDEGMKQALDHAPDGGARKVIDQIFKAVAPTVKAAQLDTGFDLRGPAASGRYTLVSATAVKEGDEIEKAFRALHGAVPADVQQFITLDAEKAGAVNIHRFTPPAELIDRELKRVFGDGPAYLAFRKDAVFIGAGDKALDALKEVLSREPKAGKLLNLEGSVARLAPLDKKETTGATAAKVFGKEPDADKVRVTLEAGQALEFRASAKVKILELVVRLQEAKNKRE
jgi:hypothetical protein